ncbi:MAG TPA: DMT family transporter [Candidatus Dojkabacteria bacterium]|nr:DMT family transporter [Candidatus Dojkabacteria bacterium]
MGIILAVLSAITFAFVMFIGKQTVNRKADPILISTFYQLAAALFYIPIIFSEQTKIPTGVEPWLLFTLNMVLYTIFTLANFQMNKHMDISLTSILGQSKTLLMFVGALILFQEPVTTNKVVGVLLIITGNVVLFLNKKLDTRGINRKGMFYLGLTIIALTITAFVDARLVQEFSINFYGMISYLIPGLLTIPFLLKNLKTTEIKSGIKKYLYPILLMGVISPIGYSALLEAYKLAPKSVVYPIGNISTLVLVLLGVIFLKEREKLQRKIIAAVIVVAGAILLSI